MKNNDAYELEALYNFYKNKIDECLNKYSPSRYDIINICFFKKIKQILHSQIEEWYEKSLYNYYYDIEKCKISLDVEHEHIYFLRINFKDLDVRHAINELDKQLKFYSKQLGYDDEIVSWCGDK